MFSYFIGGSAQTLLCDSTPSNNGSKVISLPKPFTELEQQILLDDARYALLTQERSNPSSTAELYALEVLVQVESDLLLAEIALKKAEIRLNGLNAE